MIDRNELIRLLNLARATELHAAEQYNAHGVLVAGATSTQDQGVFYEHAAEEMAHANLLRDLIHDLGGILDNTFERFLALNIEAGNGDVDRLSDRREMMQSDLEAELRAIELYTRICVEAMPEYPDVFSVVSGILRDEREHAQELMNLLA